jgi:replicative DNA helicase
MTLIHEPEIEKAVLGCILAGAKPSETGPLPPEAFTESRRHVWEAMCSLEQEATAITHLTLADRLTIRGKFKECGGAAGLMAIDNTLRNAETPSISAYAGILRERMRRRTAWDATERLQRALRDLSVPPEAAASAASATLSTIHTDTTLQRAGYLVYEMLDDWERNSGAAGTPARTPTLPWPFEAMAEDRGILRGRFNLVAGRSGNFKTGLVTDGIWHWADKLEEGGGVIGLEDGCSWFTERLTARNVPVSYLDVGYARLHEHQRQRLDEWCDRLYAVLDARVFAEDYRRTGRGQRATFPTVFRTCREMIDKGAKWIVIDHGLRIDWMPGSGVDRYDMAIGHGCQQLATLADHTGCAIVMLWHLNRANDEEAFPTRADLAESRYLDAEARKIYVLWKQRARPGYQLVTTVKATKGKEGFTAALSLADAEYGLLSRTGGYKVDFEAEAAERRDREREERQAKAAGTKAKSLWGKGGS